MGKIQKIVDGIPRCKCKMECNAPAFKNRWGYTDYARGHKPQVEKTLVPRKPKEHTDDSRPSLPIREVSREEFDRMAKASDSTYKPKEIVTQTQTVPFNPKSHFPTRYNADAPGLDITSEEVTGQYIPDAVECATSPTPMPSTGLFLIATSLTAFLAGLIIGKKRSK